MYCLDLFAPHVVQASSMLCHVLPPSADTNFFFSRQIWLPGNSEGLIHRGNMDSGSGIMETLVLMLWFVIGVAGIVWEWTVLHVGARFWLRRGYRNILINEDAQILRFEDEQE